MVELCCSLIVTVFCFLGQTFAEVVFFGPDQALQFVVLSFFPVFD